MNRKVSVYRLEHFNAAHRLHNPEWSNAENERIFGKCNNPNYHGHNYNLEVKVTGLINSDTGYVIDIKILSDIIKEHVLDAFDHKNLNLDVPEFKNLNPTAENIAVVIHDKLEKALNTDSLTLKIRLYETERNYVEYPGE
ncbi:MAG: 6-carboxytetrahydropterin synthase [Cytophagales bacterium]|nr:6-carboxytetrahydropterin synthase [Cytophagales bacterium]